MSLYSAVGNWWEYGKADAPTTPLSFDRIVEGQPPSSQALLFQLPYEILSEIIQHVDRPSLASLALVNRDCRQLARSSQFSNIVLDYGNNRKRLLTLLVQESEERRVSTNRGLTPLPYLGACIRRATVKPAARKEQENQGFNTCLYGLRQEPDDSLAQHNKKYFQMLEAVLFDSKVLPHLELLLWEDSQNGPTKKCGTKCYLLRFGI